MVINMGEFTLSHIDIIVVEKEVMMMTGFVMCQKYTVLNDIIPKGIEGEDQGMCFISFDDLLLNMLSQWPDIGYQTVMNKSKVVSGVIQYIVEVVSHYKQYFSDIPIILYHTDVDSHPELFKTGMENGNEYRLNYISKMNTVKYRDFRTLYTESLFGIIQTVVNSVVDLHLIKTKNIDASLVPLVFAREYPSRPITVITWDNVDTLLSYYATNIVVVYDARQNKNILNPAVINGRSYVDTITNAINPNHYGRFASHVLVSAVGNDKRSLYGIGKRNNGYDMVSQWIQHAFNNTTIPIEYSDITVISNQIRNEDTRKDFVESYNGSDLEVQYQMLLQDEKTSILYALHHQPVDPHEVMKLFPNIQVDWVRLYV